MPKAHKTSHPVKLHPPGGKTGLGQIWNGVPCMGKGTQRTCNGTKAPERAGKGATASKEWYAKND